MKNCEPDADGQTVVTVPKEKAVFWMDGQGRWHNQHGPFEHKKLIAYFNASIRKDDDGYYVTQDCGAFVEKIYFPYQATAFFVMDLRWQPTVELLLNTGIRIALDPNRLYIHEDQLYMDHVGETIKFAQRALMKLSEGIDSEDGACWLTIGRKRYKLPEQ